jgi:hypothetical protein
MQTGAFTGLSSRNGEGAGNKNGKKSLRKAVQVEIKRKQELEDPGLDGIWVS